MNIHLIGVPLDFGGREHGAEIGPIGLRHAAIDLELEVQLSKLGHTLIYENDIEVSKTPSSNANPKLKNLEPIVETCKSLSDKVYEVCNKKGLPVVIGGDHSVALGSITAVAKARQDIGVIWVDAHGDFNTDESTPSGNIHGMPLAAIAGIGDSKLVNFENFAPKVNPENIVIIGARDLDFYGSKKKKDERRLLKEARVNVFTMKDIDMNGMGNIVNEAIKLASRNTKGIHVSFDMDAIDPIETPGVGTPVIGGITYREARLIMELISDSKKILALDIVEINPILDKYNRTAKIAVELILAALGKSLY